MTRDQKTYRLAYGMASFIVATVLLSGYHKILYPADFALAVYRFHLLPDALVNVSSLYLQWLEIVCAVCLLFIPRYRAAALWVSLILLSLFPAGIAINLYRGTPFSCGCFSSSPIAKPMDGLSRVRNVALLALNGLALVGNKRSR